MRAIKPELEIRLLGHPALLCRGVDTDAFRSLRLQRLVGMLVLEPGGVQRSRLAFQLWPDSTESQARTNLRKALHELRQAVPGVDSRLEADQQHLRWCTSSADLVDVAVFQDAVQRGDDAAAATAYGGHLLPDCYDDWAVEARDRLHQAAGAALDRLADAAAEREDHATVIDHASARLRIDPCWEPAHRHLVRAHGRLGNRAEALRSYHRCAEVLRDELDVEPDPATRRVYDEVRQVVAEPEPPLPSAPVVGRDAELGRITTAWQRAVEGHSQLLLVSGEAGIGKSRLVDELARSVQERATVARSRAYEAAGPLPWGPVVEWLRSDRAKLARESLASGWRDELAILLPELRDDSPSGGERDGGPAARTRLFDAISQSLLVGDRPVLLVIDDLQWCDVDTIELIGYLISSRRGTPVLVAGTARTEAVGPDHPLARLLTPLRREGAVTEVDLKPLDPAATVELVSQLTRSDVGVERAETLWAETGGNPLFVVEAARAWATRGSGATPAPISSTVKGAIGSRLGGLSPEARSLVELAAAHRREFTSELLMDASDQKPHDVLDALDELWQRHIIREQDVGYDFTHDKIREVVYDGISPVRRRRLHSVLAQSLIDAHGDHPGPVSGQLAAQLDAAGRASEAVVAHLRAAEHAVSVFGLDEAIASCRRGLALLERLAPGRARDERELELRLALASQVVARDGYASALGQDLYGRTLSLCRHLGRAVDPATLRGLGLAAVTSCRFDRARQFGLELLALDDDPLAVTEGHYLMGVTAFWQGTLDEAEQHLRAAIASYQPELGPTHRLYYAQDPMAVCLVRLALVRLWRGDTEEALELAEEARTFAMSIGHPMTLGYVLLYTSITAIELDDEAWLRREVAHAASVDEHSLGFIMVVQRMYQAWSGFLDRGSGAIDELTEAVAACRVESTSLHLTHGLSILARAHLRLGSFEDGLSAIREALDWSAAHGQAYSEPLLHQIEGDLRSALGDRAAAGAAFDAAIETATAQGAERFRRSAVERRAHVN